MKKRARAAYDFCCTLDREKAAGARPKVTYPERTRSKNDPKLIAAARELRDRWLEHVNAGGAGEMLLEGAGKYDVSRAIAHTPTQFDQAPRLLPAAA